MTTIAVLNQKGGVGKTTLATNLAAAAHLSRKRTLLIDLDRQGSALDWYNARGDGSALAGLSTVKVDRTLSLPKLQEIARGFEVVILDGPPRLDELTRCAAVAADLVVIPVRPGAFDLWAIEATTATLDDADTIRTTIRRAAVLRMFVVNAASTNTVIARDTPAALAGFGEMVPTVVHQRIAFADAATRGESVLTCAPGSPAAHEIRTVFQYLTRMRRRQAA